MHRTLDDHTLFEINEKLAQFLANTFILYTKTLNFHWNMVGPEFYMFHKLLEEQYKMLAEGLDELAERMRMLGGVAPGTLREILDLTSLKESSDHLPQDQMVRDLALNHEEMVEHCHKLIGFTDSVSDQGTSDLLIDQMRFHSKQAWLLRSHLKT